ncbi:MAG: hypothetical protein U0232_12140 [Thermomicrobiales bacterium]
MSIDREHWRRWGAARRWWLGTNGGALASVTLVRWSDEQVEKERQQPMKVKANLKAKRQKFFCRWWR